MRISKINILSLVIWICIICLLKFIVIDVIFCPAHLADIVLIDTAFYKKQDPDGSKEYENSKYLHIQNPVFLYCQFDADDLLSFRQKDSLKAIDIRVFYKNDTISLNKFIVKNKKTLINGEEYGVKNDIDYIKFANSHEIAYIHHHTLHTKYGFLISNIKGLQEDEAVVNVAFKFKSGRKSEIEKTVYFVK
jgi:hypothetical protein